ncbi:MAG: aminopeptidase [Chloroflexi bacterium]|nr:aminopeptidase [Chloroflexota bacterium]
MGSDSTKGQESLLHSARVVVEDCLGVKEAEQVLILVDEKSRRIGQAFFDAAVRIKAEAVLIEFIERALNGSEPPRAVAEAMKHADAIIAPTTKSVSHTAATREARLAGARIASMPGVTEDVMARTMGADYYKIRERTLKFQKIFNEGNEVRLKSPAGTDMIFFIAGRQGSADAGFIRERSSRGNLPAGESCISPLEGKTQGIAVVDASMAGVGILKQPIKLVVKDGHVTEISGGEEARVLDALLSEKGREARNIAELGIGTNDRATVSGNILEDEKVMGTVHIGLGTSSNIGGLVSASLHLDGVITRPTLIVDGRVIIKDGQHLV